MISTHVLDLQSGRPAPDVSVRLERREGTLWTLVLEEKTNSDGRIAFSKAPALGTYRLTFQVAPYLSAQGVAPFFSEIPVSFEVSEPNQKLHIPLLLSPYGYSTYRGS